MKNKLLGTALALSILTAAYYGQKNYFLNQKLKEEIEKPFINKRLVETISKGQDSIIFVLNKCARECRGIMSFPISPEERRDFTECLRRCQRSNGSIGDWK